MQPYANLSGDSGVSAFEIGPTFIRIRFVDGATYIYGPGRPGTAKVELRHPAGG